MRRLRLMQTAAAGSISCHAHGSPLDSRSPATREIVGHLDAALTADLVIAPGAQP